MYCAFGCCANKNVEKIKEIKLNKTIELNFLLLFFNQRKQKDNAQMMTMKTKTLKFFLLRNEININKN